MIFENMNDLDLKEWKKYKGDITTDAFWMTNDKGKFNIPLDNRGFKNDPDFHGLFIPEIPYQMIMRYTKKGETVWDPFGGSGTTYEVCNELNRKCIINDISPKQSYILKGDSKWFNPEKEVEMVILHPPYFNVVKFSEEDGDLSNSSSLEEFYNNFEKIIHNVNKYLSKHRMLILVCGHIYVNGEDISVGHYCMEMIRKLGYKCKAQIVKDYGETKGSQNNQENLEYYRALRGGYYKFAGDNIFVMQKCK